VPLLSKAKTPSRVSREAGDWLSTRLNFLTLSRVQYLSFAAECGVFPLKWNDVDLIIHSSEVRLMDLIRPLNLERNFYEKLKKQKNQAMLDGVAKAKNGCDYWHQNPDLVYRMRRLAAMAR
jgi:hypothetical protein